MGITGPHITDGQKAKQLAKAARYTPLGKRSFGSGRGAYYGNFPSGQAYMEHLNSNIIVIAQLEDVEVLENITDILSVEGIDLFASGPQDIAQSMGLPGQPNHPKVQEFEDTVRDLVHKAGKKMVDDVMSSTRATTLFLEGAKTYLESEK
jgi:4-hydroxy-2-oxoheptanedioate aldolase